MSQHDPTHYPPPQPPDPDQALRQRALELAVEVYDATDEWPLDGDETTQGSVVEVAARFLSFLRGEGEGGEGGQPASDLAAAQEHLRRAVLGWREYVAGGGKGSLCWVDDGTLYTLLVQSSTASDPLPGGEAQPEGRSQP